MAKNTIRRWITILFDRPSAKKAEAEMGAALGAAGKKGGENFLRELRAAFDKRMADLKNQLAKGLIDPKQFKAQAALAAKEFNSGLIAGMEKARAAGTLTDKEYLKLSKTLKTVGDTGAGAGARLGAAFLKAGVAIGAFIGFRRLLTDSVQAALQAESSVSRLDAVLQPLGLSYRKVSGEVERYLDNLQKTTRFGDEDAREALVNLVTITGDYNLSLRLLDVTAKIAEKRHTTMAAAAQTAGDASKGLTKGMKDLGINAKDTGDIVAKINRNLGDLAVEGGKTSSGQLAILNNLLGEVKESFGAAILGSDGFTGSVGDLRTKLIELNDWIKGEGGTTIRSFISLLVVGAQGIAKALASGGTIQGSINRRILDARKKAEAARLAPDKAGAERVAEQIAFTERLLTEVTTDGAKKRDEISEEEKERRKKRAKELGAELTRIEEDIAVSTLMIQEGLTESLAREMVRRKKLLSGEGTRETATTAEITAALARRDALATAATVLGEGAGEDRLPQRIDDVGVKAGSAIPPIQEMTRELFIQKTMFEQGAIAGTAWGDAVAAAAGKVFDSAGQLESKWVATLETIKLQMVDSMSGIGQAWVERADTKARREEVIEALKQENLSVERRLALEKELDELGTPWLIKFAKAKIKENIAAALEMAAKALGFAVFGFGGQAAQAAASAAGHTAAAAAWSVVAGSGGGGGGSSVGTTGGVGDGGTNLSRSENIQKPGPEIHVHFKGSSFFLPEVQKQIYASQLEAREKYGPNTKVIVHRGP